MFHKTGRVISYPSLMPTFNSLLTVKKKKIHQSIAISQKSELTRILAYPGSSVCALLLFFAYIQEGGIKNPM